MKVLMTSTRTDYNVYETIQKSDSSRWTIINAVKEYGGSVDVRPVRVGEDLSKYDLVIVNANDPRGPKTQDHLGAMWSLLQSINGGPPAVMNWDHWDIRRIWRGLVGEAINDPSGPRTDLDKGSLYQSELQEVVELIHLSYWPNMTCAWKWGDHSLLSMKTMLRFNYIFDPSLDQPVVYPFKHKFKKRTNVMVLAALTNHAAWVNKNLANTDRVKFVGCVGAPKMDRDELAALYCDSMMGMSPPYYHKGSGYWRARMVHYMGAGCVVIADPLEYGALGNAFRYTPQEIANMDREKLKQLADAQSYMFWAKVTEREDVISDLYRQLLTWASSSRRGEPMDDRGPTVLL